MPAGRACLNYGQAQQRECESENANYRDQLLHSTTFLIFNKVSNTPRSNLRSSALAPSDFACGGSSCTSMNTPSNPAATAARASNGMNCGCPPETAVPWTLAAEGSCTECVESNTTGANSRMMAS